MTADEDAALAARMTREVVHDVNNTLMGVLGCAKAALSRLDPGSPARIYVEEIRDATARSTELARQLLAFGRGAPGDLVLDDWLSSREALVRRMAGHSIEVTLQPGERRSVRADPADLDRALMRVVLAARDALPEGGALLVETGARLSITLSGPRFERAAISALRDLRVDPVTGGARLTMELDAAAVEVEPAAVSLPARRATILVVEDDPMARVALRAFLSEFDLIEAESGEEALEVTAHVDLLLCDLDLPDTSGADLTRELRARRPDLAVLLMSGYPADDALPAELIAKPIDGEALVRRIREILAVTAA